ncbi:TonB-dependent siderophore receptor [Pseudoxanthomonas sp. GW2]|uniref:TonB-dependent receptor plug domain-containing protein n=1 Tax=Pseudoxanthomonas sp. GW2 TaxID=1211114 RepID=UPI0002DE905F|nr:TonB-dependent receptor [Pseudoxanthomonas sp. GW2]
MKHHPRAASRLAALPLGIACALAASGVAAQEGPAGEAQTLDRVTVTGSRLKRADIEGAVPVTVIDRATIDASGDISVAELLRDSSFAAFGSFRPRSGSSAQAVSEVDMRGIGADRTLVLVDGRRAPYAPSTGTAADLNTIPLAAVERIEILSDGASALYGSDAIGGVVNIILRKDFEGGEVRYGRGNPAVRGGDTEEASLLFGTSSERGSLLMGASYNARGIVFSRDQIGGDVRGGSGYGNNYYIEDPDAPGEEGEYGGALPGFACNSDGFWMNGDTCAYDYNAVAASDASVRNKALFARGQYDVSPSFSVNAALSYSKASSFGRFAPTPGVLYVEEGSPNDPVKGDGLGAFIYHRYAAAGNRDNFIDNDTVDVQLGASWMASERLTLDFGLRTSRASSSDIGRGYIVTPLAEKAAANGSYNVADPFADPDVVKGFTVTTNRQGKFNVDEMFASAALDLFQMAGGTSAVAFGVEHRREDYADVYDALSESGAVAGSAGNTAGGRRKVSAAYAEWYLPVAQDFDFTLAARYDRYDDYGSDVSPKLSLRWQPLDNLTLRASVGEGFRAPALPYVHSQRAFSAEPISDYRTCVATGFSPVLCGGDANGDNIADGPENEEEVAYQVDSYQTGNPDLLSEHSRQFSVGLAWDPLDWFNLTLDYYRIQIDDRIRLISFRELVGLDNAGQPLPEHTWVKRRSNGSISEIQTAFVNEGKLDTRGLDLNLRASGNLAWGRVDSWLQVARVLEYTVVDGDTRKDPLGWVTQPKLRATWRNAWSRGDFNLAWNINYIGSQQNPAEVPPYGFITSGPGVRVGSYTTHDLNLTWNAPWNGSLSLGVNNAGDRYPELVGYDNQPWNFHLYDAYGRTVYFRVSQKF